VDLIRGLAIFFVLMNHTHIRLRLAKIAYLQGVPRQVVNSFMFNGQFGVQMFFVVSGFLITATTLRRWGTLSEISLPGFYRLRFARIAPLLILLLVILSGLHLAQFKDFIVKPKTGGLGRALLAAATFHINVLEANRGYLPGNWDIMWSLSVEEMFYLFFPVICRAFGRGRWMIGVLSIFVVLGPFSRTVWSAGNEVWSEYSYLGGMDAIALGCLTALLSARRHFSVLALRSLATAGILLVIFILCFSLTGYKWGIGRTGLDMTIIAVGSCMIVIAAAQSGWQSPAFLNPLRKMGTLSYEIYLTHMFVVFAFFNFFMSRGKPVPLIPVLFIGVIVVATTLGSVVARFYSEPMNRRLRGVSVRGSEKLESLIV
jgi:peptidoglycan/LPS O-acetylase OafA/YrhL